MEMLTDAMISASKDMNAQQSQPEFAVNLILADGDFVAAYTTMLNSKSKPREGDLRQVHLFHFEEERIIEYWDISQHVLPSMPNACGAF
jgi:predicted SnoaL-like aldol condensation-catalyzing enzyme